MKSNKLFEMLNYILDCPTEKIIDKIHISGSNNMVHIELSNLPMKTLKLFRVNDKVIGYFSFEKTEDTEILNVFDDTFNSDSNTNEINHIVVNDINGNELLFNVYWNSLFYELDSNSYIMLFTSSIVGREKRS